MAKIKAKRLLSIILTLTLLLSAVFASSAVEVSASSKAPARVKIKSAAVSGTEVKLTWKKAKRASKYQVALRTKGTGWKYVKSVRKTAANKKKYSSAKYKCKASGSKYKVYKKSAGYKYKTLKTLKGTSYTYKKGKAGSTYTFVVRGVSGKKKGKWSKPVTRKIPAAPSPKPQAEQPAQQQNVSDTNDPGAEGLLGTENIKTTSGTAPVEETSNAYLDKQSFKLTNGESAKITLKNYKGSANVTWKSSNAKVVKVSSTSGTKKITATVASVAESGTATITATADGKSYTCTVTARPKTALSRTSLTVTKGYKTAVTLNNYYGTTNVTWKSANTKIAAISSTTGTYNTKVYIKGVAASGSTTVTGTAGGKTYKISVSVRDVPSIKEGDLTLPVGATQQLTVQNYTGTPTWSSSKTSVATVSAKGLVTVKASSGKATITANCGGKKATCVITARKKTPLEATTFVKKTYSYGGKAMINATIPKDWKLTVTGISSSTCEPIVLITDSTGKYGVYQRLTMPAVKSKKAQEYWRTNTGLDLPYPIPVTGYDKKGYDAAGLFCGLVTYNGMKSYAVEKKIGKSAFNSDVIVARATDKKGNKLRFIFSGQVHDLGSYDVNYKGTTLNALTATTSSTLDVWFLVCQDIMYLQAPYNDFEDWFPVLSKTFASIEYTKACVDRYVESSDATEESIRQNSENFNAYMDQLAQNFSAYILG